MKQSRLHVGRAVLRTSSPPVTGRWVEAFYQIANYDQLRPFFLSIVSSCDLWMFLSSTGALTAGRGNPDLALFPYYTDDKIHDGAETTGGKTIVIAERKGRRSFWEPFSARYQGVYAVRRNLYKNRWGNQLLFEEDNPDLGLTFRYGWFHSERFGLVRRAWLTNRGSGPVRVRLLDGIQNLMPCGVGSQFQLDKSTLLDAYKRNELVGESGLGLCRLSSIPIDRPEPAEALRATTVWSMGLRRSCTLLSSVQLDRFRQDLPIREEADVRGERGAYFIEARLALPPGRTTSWLVVADVGRGPSEVTELDRLLRRPDRLAALVQDDIARGTRELQQMIAAADGLQKTAESLGDARHGSNVLFNLMRGGIFDAGYAMDAGDLRAFVRTANRVVAGRCAGFFRRLPEGVSYSGMVALAARTGDRQLERLSREYLPLAFSRRHGDPSRPWNRFSIPARKPDGTRIRAYEGNWRDIFQNWEALAVSFPEYVSGMICRFVSASTADGYNPYRITRDGIDWEVLDPSDPWAHIGYWGDHQLIYLLKLLEILHRHQPATLQEFLTRDLFAYANVPYRIKPYERLLQDPKETVEFDRDAEEEARRRVQAVGSDGKLLWDERGDVRLVNLTEKLLVSVLAKLSNFVPEAGIWMNTQRPEWNDANNALVGNGVSMVTLCYLRRYLAFCLEVLAPQAGGRVDLSIEVERCFGELERALDRHRRLLKGGLTDRDRRRVLEDLGRAGSRYRRVLYQRGLSGERRAVAVARLRRMFAVAREWVDHSIRANRRFDGLYHAYNLIRIRRDRTVPIRRLYEMLEGQVAALSSGLLSAEESVEVLAALRRSAMYRADQHSYLLYPNRQLPRFVDRNNLSPADVRRSRLLSRLLADGDRSLVERDVRGRCHFNGALTNARDVKRVLEQLAASGYAGLVRRESEWVLGRFERLFDHESFTGRSGTFFAYEGLGSIYWHMVSKLLLAVQESYFRAVETGARSSLSRKLAKHYYDVRAGMGDRKTPAEYGAFPMDPYSHTPAHMGARQPGLTGQVKEDILCRFGELGVQVREGRIWFQPMLLRREEFLTEAGDFQYYDVAGAWRRLPLRPGSLAFTYCQVPVVYQMGEASGVSIWCADGSVNRQSKPDLDEATSRAIFERTGRVRRITVQLRLG